MKKFIAFLILILSSVAVSYAQVSAVTVLGVSNPSYFPGQSVAVTFSVTDDGNFGSVSYDVLFSAATTAASSAYSSYIKGAMVCTGRDNGFTFNDTGNRTNILVYRATVPLNTYSGNIVVIAAENSTFLTCSSTQGYLTFTIANTPTPTNTPTVTATKTITNTPTNTMTWTVTNTKTFTTTYTPTATPTSSKTSTLTFTVTNTPTATLSPTITLTPTITPTSVNYQTEPMRDWTGQKILSLLWGTSQIHPSFTITPTFTQTFTQTQTPTQTPTFTQTFTPTFTFTCNPSWTPRCGNQ